MRYLLKRDEKDNGRFTQHLEESGLGLLPEILTQRCNIFLKGLKIHWLKLFPSSSDTRAKTELDCLDRMRLVQSSQTVGHSEVPRSSRRPVSRVLSSSYFHTCRMRHTKPRVRVVILKLENSLK